MSECAHKRGDHFNGWWVCADCFAKMSQRPVKYGMGLRLGSRKVAETRQIIMWQADTAVAESGTTFSQFLRWIQERFVRRGRVEKSEAAIMAVEAMRSLADLDEYFGDRGFSWDRSGAYDIADEEMSYWDDDSGESNG